MHNPFYNKFDGKGIHNFEDNEKKIWDRISKIMSILLYEKLLTHITHFKSKLKIQPTTFSYMFETSTEL